MLRPSDIPAATDHSEAFAALVSQFLPAPKLCKASVRWRPKGNRDDYFHSVLRIEHGLGRHFKARVILLSHTYFEPRKYSFALLLNNRRVYSLDTEPRSSHRNLLTGSVKCTHWSIYPCDTAIPDNRQQTHIMWLDEFFKKCNITHSGYYTPPVHDKVQWELGL